jgi:hypothetical protein
VGPSFMEDRILQIKGKRQYCSSARCKKNKPASPSLVHLASWQRDLVDVHNLVRASVVASVVDYEQLGGGYGSSIVVDPHRQVYTLAKHHRQDCNGNVQKLGICL